MTLSGSFAASKSGRRLTAAAPAFRVVTPAALPARDTLLRIWSDALPDLDERRIDWAYRRHPHGRPAVWLLDSRENDEPFGSCVVVPRRFQHGGTIVPGGIPGDFAVKRAYRTLGPALSLQRSVTQSENHDLLLAFPNASSVGIQRRVGFEDLGHLTVFRRLFHSGPILRRRLHPTLAWIASLFVDFGIHVMGFWLGRSPLNGYSVTHDLTPGFGALWKRVRGRYACAGCRDLGYLAWRYVEHPYKSYAFFGLEANGSGRVVAYLVYYVEENIAYIDDFLVEDPTTDLRRLFDAFSAWCLRSRLDAMSLEMLENATYTRLFHRMGFTAERTPDPVLCFRRGAAPIDPADAFITIGDCDI